MPWFDTTVPTAVAAFTVAWMVTVTEPPLAIEPFQTTVFVAGVAVAVPAVAVAETRVSDEGSTSVELVAAGDVRLGAASRCSRARSCRRSSRPG